MVARVKPGRVNSMSLLSCGCFGGCLCLALAVVAPGLRAVVGADCLIWLIRVALLMAHSSHIVRVHIQGSQTLTVASH